MTKTFASTVTVHFGDKVANAKSIMGLASLAAEFGAEVEIRVEGSDEEKAAPMIVKLVSEDLAHPEHEE